MVEFELFHHVNQAAMPDLVAGRQRIDIANQLIGFAHIAADNADQRLVHIALVGKFHDRDIEPLFIDGLRIRPKTSAANVDDMRRTGEEADQHAVMERRRNHGNVMQVTSAFPRIVCDIDISVEDVLTPDPADEMRNRICHRIDVARSAGDSLSQHLAMRIINPRRQIARFAHRGRKGRTHQRLRLFFDDRNQPVPHHLISDFRMFLCHL